MRRPVKEGICQSWLNICSGLEDQEVFTLDTSGASVSNIPVASTTTPRFVCMKLVLLCNPGWPRI